ncbi:YrdB family protein [uncultured Draconibacterium sp.]|uniref:YrdB family protein n=1 Tax=uncultured Draconibacterium sp. TaxID=1573823 RepID=UPI0032607771
MHKHPVNLALRFFLEIAALVALGKWGWQLTNTWHKYLLALAVPLLAALIWGVFAVPNDPSRSGKAPVPVSGAVRLLIELLFFALAGAVLFQMEYILAAAILAIATLVHYLLSYQRVRWLLRQKAGQNRS